MQCAPPLTGLDDTLCCLFFLRALRLTTDFFLASDHDKAGYFYDVVLLYRLKEDQGHGYRAILLQANHSARTTHKKLTSCYPFQLRTYLESFKDIRQHWQHPLNVGEREIQLQEVKLVLYTNNSCVIGDAADDVTDNPRVQHLNQLLNIGGQLLQISEAGRVRLLEGEDTSEFLDQLILCTDQASVGDAEQFLEEELCQVLRLTSRDVARNLRVQLKRRVKAWRATKGREDYLSAESREWKEVVEEQIKRLNDETLTIADRLSLDFTEAALEEFGAVKMSWMCVSDEYQANAVRVRLSREEKGKSLIIDGKSVYTIFGEIEALWKGDICPTLVVVLSAEEGSPVLLQRLQEEVQKDADRRVVVVARGEPPSEGWSRIDPQPTWSVLRQATRDRLLDTPVRLQGAAVALRDIFASSHDDVMSDQVISALCIPQLPIKLGEAMPQPHEYYVPRCLVRASSREISLQSLESRNILIFSSTYFLPVNVSSERLKTFYKYEIDAITAIENPTILRGIRNDYDIRQLCCRFRVSGLSGQISDKGLQGDIKEFVPYSWTCEENIVIVEGLPSVGKSTFVAKMCCRVKEQFPEAWVLRVDLGGKTDYIREREFTEVRDIKELLLEDLAKTQNDVERRLLEHSLSVTGNVFLFLDAFDEVSPDYTSKCCVLLQGIAREIKFRQMVVTTRPVTTRDVEEALQTRAFTLPMFSEEEQVLFIKQFSEARGKQVGEEEISSLRQFAGPVLEIPLLCRMWAEVLLQRREEIFVKFLSPWRKVLLYQLFVEQSVKERLVEKLGLDISRPGLKVLLEFHINSYLQNLQGLAVRKLIPVDKLPPQLSLSTIMPNEKLGLVVNTGDRVDFEHHTLAEYFLGRWLAFHWQHCPQELLREVFHREGYQFVIATFIWSLFRDNIADLQTVDGWTALMWAAGRGHLEVVKLLLENGADLNIETENGWTVLMRAAVEGHREVVKFLLENGAYLKIKTGDIWTVLMRAAVEGHREVVKFLLENGAYLNIKTEDVWMVLMRAASQGHLEVVKLLLENGADLHKNNEDGWTALMGAASEGHLEVVKLLLDKGADLNIKFEYGWTVLMGAAGQGHLEVVKLLLDNGAGLNIKTEGGWTALMWAAARGHLGMVKLLSEKGADTNVKNFEGESPLTLAARKGHKEVVAFLTGTN